MTTLKLFESSSVPSDETGKALSQAPLSFYALANNQALDSRSNTRNMFSPIPLNNRKVPGFLSTRVIWQGSTTTSPPPRLHCLCKLVSVRYVNFRKNRFHFPPTRPQGKKALRYFLLSYNKDHQNSLGTQPVYTHPLLTTHCRLSLENQKEPVEEAQLLSAQVSGRCSQNILQLGYGKGILQQNECLIWVQHIQLWCHSLKRFPLLIDSSRNALYIHRGSQKWIVTRFDHPNPRKEPSEQGLHYLRMLSLRMVSFDLQANCSEPLQ